MSWTGHANRTLWLFSKEIDAHETHLMILEHSTQQFLELSWAMKKILCSKWNPQNNLTEIVCQLQLLIHSFKLKNIFALKKCKDSPFMPWILTGIFVYLFTIHSGSRVTLVAAQTTHKCNVIEYLWNLILFYITYNLIYF